MIDYYYKEGLQYIEQEKSQLALDFSNEEQKWFEQNFRSIKRIRLLGPELLLGKLYDEIGFNKIQEDLFRHLVISRIINPGSKLQTSRYLMSYFGVEYSARQIYTYMDKLYNKQQQQVEQISYEHTLAILEGNLSVVFYDVTTLYFEIEKEDELRAMGFSKDGKHKHPQIILGLLVSYGGYPLAYHMHKGDTYEGNTMLPIVDAFKSRFDLNNLMVIADAGLINKTNIETLQTQKYEFIIGARIKVESAQIKEKIKNHKFTNGENLIIAKEDGIKLIVNYSQKRANKDQINRQKGLQKLENKLKTGKLTKSSINNRGYNKYLDLEGEVTVKINYEKYDEDQKWDGLKGYVTNTNLPIENVLENYKELWKIEKAFRISKTDLRIRPIYHRKERRIEAHLCISFTAYKIYKELERQLNEKDINISVERAIELMKNIYGITLQNPNTKSIRNKLFYTLLDQENLLKSFDISLG
jgi:transposase